MRIAKWGATLLIKKGEGEREGEREREEHMGVNQRTSWRDPSQSGTARALPNTALTHSGTRSTHTPARSPPLHPGRAIRLLGRSSWSAMRILVRLVSNTAAAATTTVASRRS
jgi:hypothetical protein